jgi:HemY protein
MLRAVKFILLAAVLLVLAWWIGGLPGDVTAHAGRYTVETSTPAALLILFLIALLFTVLLRVIGGIRRAPGGFGTWRGGRRRKLGEVAMQRGIVALAAGDAAAARAEAGRARKLLGDTPLSLLLTAEAARLGGQAEQARAAFAQLTQHKEMAFLGHHGLFRHSFAEGAHDAAHAHVQAAEAAYPGSAWVRQQRLALEVRQGNWAAALAMTTVPKEIAALATGAAQASTDPSRALKYAKQAVRADPTLAPAVVELADALRAKGKPRAAKRALLSGWKTAPHRLIAQSWFAAQATPLERAQSAAELAAANPDHVESELALAETAWEARLTGEARRHAEAALAAGATDERAHNILAALDGKAATPTSPEWVCTACHTPQLTWSPACPACRVVGSLGKQGQGGSAPLAPPRTALPLAGSRDRAPGLT